MQQNPAVEISASSPECVRLRLHGRAAFVGDRAAKEMCLENPIAKG